MLLSAGLHLGVEYLDVEILSLDKGTRVGNKEGHLADHRVVA